MVRENGNDQRKLGLRLGQTREGKRGIEGMERERISVVF